MAKIVDNVNTEHIPVLRKNHHFNLVL